MHLHASPPGYAAKQAGEFTATTAAALNSGYADAQRTAAVTSDAEYVAGESIHSPESKKHAYERSVERPREPRPARRRAPMASQLNMAPRAPAENPPNSAFVEAELPNPRR